MKRLRVRDPGRTLAKLQALLSIVFGVRVTVNDATECAIKEDDRSTWPRFPRRALLLCWRNVYGGSLREAQSAMFGAPGSASAAYFAAPSGAS